MKPLYIGYGEQNADLTEFTTTNTSVQGQRIFLTDDDLKTHLYGIGAPRTGKSKLIEHMAREFIRRGQGFCLIDPHGHLYQEILTWLAFVQPEHVEIILFDPSYDEHIVGFNPFRWQPGDIAPHVDRMVQTTVKAWRARDTSDTPTLGRRLSEIIHLGMELHLPIEFAWYLLQFDLKLVREHLAGKLDDPIIRSELQELSLFKQKKDFDHEMVSTLNRLFPFLRSRQIRRITGLDSNSINIHEIIEQGKILLVNLQPKRGVLSRENARLLGSLLVSELIDTALERPLDDAGNPPSNFFAIIDEFQNFLTPDIGEQLTQLPKYGLKFMLFHQFIQQLQGDDKLVFEAVKSACQTKVLFGGLSYDDAHAMVRETFLGQVDPKRIKFIIEQTKFWPEVGRATVYNESHSHGTGRSDTTGSGFASGTNSGSSLTWNGEDLSWSPVHSESSGSSSSSSDFTASGSSEMDTDSYGTSDVPFIFPKEYREVSSITSFTPEETYEQLAALLHNQPQRHFLIQRPGQPTVIAVTPMVEKKRTEPEDITAYKNKLLGQRPTSVEVDQQLAAMHQRLLLEAHQPESEIEFDPMQVWEKPLDK